MDNSKTGSTAIYMPYGEYCRNYPKGRRDDDAKAKDKGYCIIDNEDKNNVCWITERAFRLINEGFNRLAQEERRRKKL